MFLGLNVGTLTEPLTGRHWDATAIQRELVQRIACFQRHGLTAGDRAFLHHGNSLEFFVDLVAIWNLGACAVPIDPRLTRFEVENLGQAAAPRLSIWPNGSNPSIPTALSSMGIVVIETPAPLANGASVSPVTVPTRLVSLDRPALILFTSGTTGQPKGVVHTHRSLRARWMSLQQSLGTEKFRRTLCLLPTHFGHGLLCNSLFPWLSGQSLFVAPPFKPELVMQLGTLLDDFEITFLSSVPSVWRLALKTSRPPRRSVLERVICGSAPLSAFLWKGIQAWTGAGEVLNAYGITETGSWTAGTTVDEFVAEDGLIGEPWGATIRILKSSSTERAPSTMAECAPSEEGYVWINTPALMHGYLDRPDLTDAVVAQGWFVTGDIGMIDERGLLYLRGREREEINKGGMKVYPGDIDAVAERHPQIVDVCTFAYEDPLHGENVGIAVVLKSANDDGLRDVYEFLREHLARFQMPQRWYLLPEIPRTSRGKVNRAHVADQCRGLTPTRVQSPAPRGG